MVRSKKYHRPLRRRFKRLVDALCYAAKRGATLVEFAGLASLSFSAYRPETPKLWQRWLFCEVDGVFTVAREPALTNRGPSEDGRESLAELIKEEQQIVRLDAVAEGREVSLRDVLFPQSPAR